MRLKSRKESELNGGEKGSGPKGAKEALSSRLENITRSPEKEIMSGDVSKTPPLGGGGVGGGVWDLHPSKKKRRNLKGKNWKMGLTLNW